MKKIQFFMELTFFLIRKIMPKKEIKIYNLKWSDFLEVQLPKIKRKKRKHHHILTPYWKESK
jgi:hypothetical protein